MAKTEAKTAGGEDQSMEEILQSIRRIIAEEGDAEAQPAASELATPESSPVEEDVLELTDVVTENGAVININDVHTDIGEIEFEAVPAETESDEDFSNSGDDILKNIDAALGTTTFTPSPATEVDSLLSRATAEATSQALKNLKRPHIAHTPHDSASFRSGATVEDLVVEALKPMLKAWLDDNLPAMVERIVEREIRNLT